LARKRRPIATSSFRRQLGVCFSTESLREPFVVARTDDLSGAGTIEITSLCLH
jgi:hypothetical protein